MQSKLALYWQLLHNGEQLTALQRSCAIPDFVQQMACYLQWPDLTFEVMLSFLDQQNNTMLQPELELFSRFWQPSDYRKKDQALNWVPAFEPLQQPFLHSFIISLNLVFCSGVSVASKVECELINNFTSCFLISNFLSIRLFIPAASKVSP